VGAFFPQVESEEEDEGPPITEDVQEEHEEPTTESEDPEPKLINESLTSSYS